MKLTDLITKISPGFAEIKPTDLLVFIHGYRVSFADPLRSSALLAEELEFGGTPICCSWPSAGKYLGHGTDEDNVADSHYRLQDFLTKLHQKLNPIKIHLAAHSMGNRALMSTLYDVVPLWIAAAFCNGTDFSCGC
jgi:esterase/lipase superfamily enzyme